MKKIKVVWICHFSNSRIQDRLDLNKNSDELAPWISSLVEEFKLFNEEVELHIVSPHKWLKRDMDLKIDGINYYFFRTGIPFINKPWPSYFKLDFFTLYSYNRWKIKRLVNKIKPDIINLHGIENPYYSLSILGLKKYPVLISIQGLNLESQTKSIKERIFSIFEVIILRKNKHFGIRVGFLKNLIIKYNPHANIYWHKYPFSSELDIIDNAKKEYDCVFFARLTKDKGIEDLLKAISLVKKERQISVAIIGKGKDNYLLSLSYLIKSYNIEDCITFYGFLSSRQEVHKIVQSSRLTILPTYNDVLPGTIIESMKLKTPVVSYTANGVVDFNEHAECIKLVPKGDIILLSKEIVNLLDNENARKKLIKNAMSYVKTELDNTKETKKLIDSYKAILEYD